MKISINDYEALEKIYDKIIERMENLNLIFNNRNLDVLNSLEEAKKVKNQLQNNKEAYLSAEAANNKLIEQLNNINISSDVISDSNAIITDDINLNLKSNANLGDYLEDSSKSSDTKVSLDSEYINSIQNLVQDVQNRFASSFSKLGIEPSNVKNNLFYYTNENGDKLLPGSFEYIDAKSSGEKLNIVKTLEFNNISNNLINNFNLRDEIEVQKLATLCYKSKYIDIYHDVAEGIINVSQNIPGQFENAFGLPLTYTNEIGEQVTNVELLTTELFTKMNFDNIFIKDSNGAYKIKDEIISSSDDMISITNMAFEEKSKVNFFEQLYKLISNYLKGIK